MSSPCKTQGASDYLYITVGAHSCYWEAWLCGVRFYRVPWCIGAIPCFGGATLFGDTYAYKKALMKQKAKHKSNALVSHMTAFESSGKVWLTHEVFNVVTIPLSRAYEKPAGTYCQ